MRIARKLRDDQEIIRRFIAVLGGAMIELSSNKLAGPGFFIVAHTFISEFIEGGFFKKEMVLMKALEDVDSRLMMALYTLCNPTRRRSARLASI